MSRRIFQTAALAAALLLPGSVGATTFKFTFTGSFADGYDYTSEFGSVRSLTGVLFTATSLLDDATPNSGYNGNALVASYFGGGSSGFASPVASVFTVDGVIRTTSGGFNGLVRINNKAGIGFDGVETLAEDNFAVGQVITTNRIDLAVSSAIHDFIVSTTNFAPLDFAVQPGDVGSGTASFVTTDYATGKFVHQAGGNLNIATLKIEALNGVAAVPEPSSWAMMVCGFGFLGAALRRRESLRLLDHA